MTADRRYDSPEQSGVPSAMRSGGDEIGITVRAGAGVLPMIAEEAFVTEWQELAAQDRKFTVLQEPAFVISWYRQHESLFEPVVCLGRDTGGRLFGLMPLARDRESGGLTHAGDFHAEYHGWIALPSLDEVFAVECLIALKSTFPLRRWAWSWLPPGTPTGFLASRRLIENGVFPSFRTQQSPVWNLEDEARLNEVMKTKSIRNQMNRFKKQGGFFLERIRDKERTRQLLEVLRSQCDFRQEVTQGVRPFADNPRKEPFFLERQNFPESNHFTVLWSNGRPVSFHFGACGKDTLLLGLTAYDPTESRNSPGKVHLIELARMVKEEGFRRIDLTPGGDQYKEFVANASQELVIPTFHFSRAASLRTAFRETLHGKTKEALAAARIRPETLLAAMSWLRALPTRLTNITPRKLLYRIARIFHEDVVYLQYAIDCKRQPAETERDPEIFAQRYEDLLTHPAYLSPRARRRALAEALKRFTAGQTLYSMNREGELLHFGWVVRGGQRHLLEGVNAAFDSPPDSAVLYDFFTHPKYRGRGLYQRNLRQILRDLAAAGVQKAFIGVLKGNDGSRRAIEKVGFSMYRTYRRRRILWIEKKEERAHE
jgi:CelD/BcsL family acetyltransferase involved in cellulose biosynthesis/RimJ/RimL family protein N-acetyltransferase